MIAPGLSTTIKSIRLNISPSSAPASKPLRAAQAMRALPDLGGTPALGNVAQAVSATSSLAGAPPLARKYNPSSMFKQAINQKVGSCPISGIRMNWQASTPATRTNSVPRVQNGGEAVRSSVLSGKYRTARGRSLP